MAQGTVWEDFDESSLIDSLDKDQLEVFLFFFSSFLVFLPLTPENRVFLLKKKRAVEVEW